VAFGKFLGEQANGGELLAGKIEVETGVLDHDLLDADFHGVAGFRSIHENGAGHGMRPAARICKAKLGDLVHRSSRLNFIHPWLHVSMETVSPESTISFGFSVGSNQPHCTVSLFAGSE